MENICIWFPFGNIFLDYIIRSGKTYEWKFCLFSSNSRLVYSYWLVIAFWNCAINASNRFFNVLTRIMAALIAMQIFDALDMLIRYSK